MNRPLGKAIRWLITGVIIVFLIIFARTVDWASAWSSIRNASHPLLAIAIGVNFLSLAFKAVRWWLFLRAAGSCSFPLALRATIAGAGLNNVLVANGGEAARVVFVSRATGIQSSTVLATLALERLFDPVGFVILLVYAIIAFQLPPSLERWRHAAELLLVVILIALVWFVRSSKHAKPSEIHRDVVEAHGWWEKLKAYLAGFAASARVLTSGPRFIAALALSMLSWMCQVWTFEYAANAAHVDMPRAASLAALLAINLGLLIRATPGNVGFFQFVFALATAPFGIERNAAIAVSLLIQTLQIIPTTLLGVALAPEFIFRKSSGRQQADELAATHELSTLGSVAEESEELDRIARQT
jgi:uncharacterized protein (TIRG00374 family)